MKKSLLLLVPSALILGACSQETNFSSDLALGEKTTVSFSVNLPDDLATRAIGDGSQATQLNVLVFDADTEGDLTFVLDANAQFAPNSNQANVNLNLVTGKNYKIAFFAASNLALSGDNPVYSVSNTDGTLSVNYSAMNSADNNNDAYDCFYSNYSTGTLSGAINETIKLTRPVAQVNWGTTGMTGTTGSNYESIFGTAGEFLLTNLEANLYQNMNLLTGVCSNENVVSIGNFALPTASQGTFPNVGTTTYNYVAVQYVLAPPTSTLTNLTLTINNSGEGNTAASFKNDIDVTSAPLQANYQTNIYGNLLTGNVSFNVSTSSSWDGSTETEVLETFTVNDLQVGTPYNINEDGVYKFSGNMVPENLTNNSSSYYVNLTPGINAIIDGGGLSTTDSDNTFHIIFQDNASFPGAQSDITNAKPITGTLTFQNFTEGNISIKTGNTTINIKNNTITALDLGAGNINLNITDNIFKGDGNVTHPRWDTGPNENNAYLYMIKYNLVFENNYMYGCETGGPVQINGWLLNHPDGSWQIEELEGINSITSFANNTLIVQEYKNTQNSGLTAAFTFYGDGTFYWSNDSTTDPTYSQAATDFVNMVLDPSNNNKFYIAAPCTGANQFKFSQINSGNSIRFDYYNTEAPSEETGD